MDSLNQHAAPVNAKTGRRIPKYVRATKAPIVRRTEFGVRLRELRLARGLGQAHLGEAAGLSGPTINSLERGLSSPGTGTRLKLETFFGVQLPEVRPEHKVKRSVAVKRPRRAYRNSLEKARAAKAAKKAERLARPALGVETHRAPEKGRSLKQDILALMFQYGVKDVADAVEMIQSGLIGETIEAVRMAVAGKAPHEQRRG